MTPLLFTVGATLAFIATMGVIQHIAYNRTSGKPIALGFVLFFLGVLVMAMVVFQ
jgi:hypothetical protein